MALTYKCTGTPLKECLVPGKSKSVLTGAIKR